VEGLSVAIYHLFIRGTCAGSIRGLKKALLYRLHRDSCNRVLFLPDHAKGAEEESDLEGYRTTRGGVDRSGVLCHEW
jgi:hypothetical protein